MRAGAKATTEQRAKMSKGHIETWKSRLDWSLANDVMDLEMNLSTRNRSTEFVTFRKLKNLIDSGGDIHSLTKSGISKHLLAFMSRFLQGDFKHVNRGSILTPYSQGKSLDEIHIQLGIHRSDITFLRALFGIKAKGPTFINRKKTETPLTQRQIEIVCGSLMGDAKKISPSAVGFDHGAEQKEYLLWKYAEMESVASPRSMKAEEYLDARSGSKYNKWRFYTHANSDLEMIISHFYPEGLSKNPTQDALDMLSPLSLAVWYQDDGSTDFNFRSISSRETNTQPLFSFCTDSFSVETCKAISAMLLDRFGLSTRLTMAHNKKGFRVAIELESNEKFVNLIRPHVLPMFLYKIDYLQYVMGRTNDPVQVNLANVIRAPRGDVFKNLPIAERDEWARKALQYNRKRGFESLVQYGEDEAKKDFSLVLKFDTGRITGDEEIRTCPTGSKLPIGFCPHFWEVKPKMGRSPKEIFEDDSALTEIIMGLLDSGFFPGRRKIMQKLRLYRGNKSAGSFMPCAAKAVFQKYAMDGTKVVDFCAGYGGRMVGAMAASRVSSYSCCDVSIPSVLGIRKMYEVIGTKPANIDNADSLSFLQSKSDKEFDLCFTSPPYFDAERYEDGSQQSSAAHPMYGQWFEKWLLPCVKEACRVSSLVLVNIANTGAYRIADDLRGEAQKLGILSFEHHIRYNSFGGRFRYEPLFGFCSKP